MEKENCKKCGSLLGRLPNVEVEGGQQIYICPCEK